MKADANSDAVMRLAITSDLMPVDDMTILVEDQVLMTLPPLPASLTFRFMATARRFSASISIPGSLPALVSPLPTCAAR